MPMMPLSASGVSMTRSVAELLDESFGGPEDATVDADVLTEHEHRRSRRISSRIASRPPGRWSASARRHSHRSPPLALHAAPPPREPASARPRCGGISAYMCVEDSRRVRWAASPRGPRPRHRPTAARPRRRATASWSSSHSPWLVEVAPQPEDRVPLLPASTSSSVAVAAGVVGRRVVAESVGHRLDQRRAPRRASTIERLARRL